MEIVYLGIFSFLAGFIDAIAGGGGLVQLPALFLFVPPPLNQAFPAIFGTNKFSSVCGTSVAAWQYARKVRLPPAIITPGVVGAFLFSFLGARTVTLISNEALKPIILVLFGVAAFITYVKKDFGALQTSRISEKHYRIAAFGLGAGIGFYDGFFGPGTGTFLLIGFMALFGYDFLHATAGAKIINLTTNIAALVFFISSGNIYWQYALPMAACNVLGGFLGSRMAILKGNRFIRAVFLVVVLATIAKFAFDLLLG